MGKKKLAIISSYHEDCGIAQYAERIEPVLSEYYDVQVLKLETEVLKSNNKELRSLGDKLIEEMAEKLKEFDCVNIQFEAGLYGYAPDTVMKRIQMLLDSANDLVFTFHTVNFAAPGLSKSRLFSKNGFRVLREYYSAKRWPDLYDRLIKILWKIDNTPGKKATILVHDDKTRRYISRVYRFEHVYAHPLGLSSKEEREMPHTEEEKAAFRKKYDIADDIVTIGIFGFVSEYKGHLLAIKALQQLPEKYHLLVFGEQHPASVQPFVTVDPYLDRLLTYISETDTTNKKMLLRKDGKNEDALIAKELARRTHFFGNVNNDDFAQAMRCCDVVLLPYVEVNQMGSGIAALALENHANGIYANTKCFHELAQFFPDCFPFFDIGNYLQLAQSILSYKNVYDEAVSKALSVYNLEENVRRFYVNMFER